MSFPFFTLLICACLFKKSCLFCLYAQSLLECFFFYFFWGGGVNNVRIYVSTSLGIKDYETAPSRDSFLNCQSGVCEFSLGVLCCRDTLAWRHPEQALCNLCFQFLSRLFSHSKLSVPDLLIQGKRRYSTADVYSPPAVGLWFSTEKLPRVKLASFSQHKICHAAARFHRFLFFSVRADRGLWYYWKTSTLPPREWDTNKPRPRRFWTASGSAAAPSTSQKRKWCTWRVFCSLARGSGVQARVYWGSYRDFTRTSLEITPVYIIDIK